MSERALDPNFLAEYERESEWAAGHAISQRTSARYRALPNGLPFLFWCGSIWIPKREGREWIASRVQRRTARRPHRHRQAAQADHAI